MANKQYSWVWNTDADTLIVTVIDFDGTIFKSGFTKEFLEDCDGVQFVKALEAISNPQLAKPFIPKPPVKHYALGKLLLPGIREVWQVETGGFITAMNYHPECQCYRLTCSQGVAIDLPQHLLEDELYYAIRHILIYLGQRLDSLYGQVSVNVPYDQLAYYIQLHWKVQPDQLSVAIGTAAMAMAPPAKDDDLTYWKEQYLAKILKPAPYTASQALDDMLTKSKQAKEAMHAALYGIAPPPLQATKSIKELHVYDLGEGMLVPCEMMHDLASMFKLDQPPKAYGKSIFESTEALMKALGMDDKESEGMLTKFKSQYVGKPFLFVEGSKPKIQDKLPGKVWIMDSPKMAEWWVADDLIADALVPDDSFGGIIKKLTGVKAEPKPQPVAIPKKPKQVTAETLKHYHKLLGGKKNPF